MTEDPIVEEVRRTRAEYAAKFNYDLRALCDDLRKRSETRGELTVTHPSRPVPSRPEPAKKAG
jgi:hypothetical protein